MKQFFLAALSLISFSTFAQHGDAAKAKVKTVQLQPGQKLNVELETSQNTDMSMGMTIKNDSHSKNIVNIISASGNDIKLSSTVKKAKMKGDMMGQPMVFDSDVPDTSSDLYKAMIKEIDVPKNYTLNKATGISTPEQPAKDPVDMEVDEDDPSEMLGSLADQGDANLVEQLVFFVPANVKAGQSWIDSTSAKGLTNTVKFLVESVSGNIVTLNTTGTIKGSSRMNMQGTDLDMTMNSTTAGKMEIDVSTNLVKKKKITVTMNGSIDMMGQSMNFTGTTVTDMKVD